MSNDDGATPSEELVGIVARAGQLGFNTSRVATALGISADGLAAIHPLITESAPAHANHAFADSSRALRECQRR